MTVRTASDSDADRRTAGRCITVVVQHSIAPIVASIVYILALIAVILTAIALSVREQPLAFVLRVIPQRFATTVNDTMVFTAVVVLFDAVVLVLLVRYGVNWS